MEKYAVPLTSKEHPANPKHAKVEKKVEKTIEKLASKQLAEKHKKV